MRYNTPYQGDEATADELLVERLRGNLNGYGPELLKLREKAVDDGMWLTEVAPGEEGEAAIKGEEAVEGEADTAMSAAAANDILHLEEELSESDEEAEAAEAAQAAAEALEDHRTPDEIFLALKPKRLKVAELKEVLAARCALATPRLRQPPPASHDHIITTPWPCSTPKSVS